MGSKSASSNEPEPTQEERALARRGAEQWNRFARDIVPVADTVQANTRAKKSDEATIARGLADSARADTADTTRTLMRNTPTSTGAAAMGLQEMNNRGNAAMGAGAAQGATELVDRETRGLMSLAASGRRVDSSANQSLAEAGAGAQEQAYQKAENERATQQGMISGLSSGAGLAAGSGNLEGLADKI